MKTVYIFTLTTAILLLFNSYNLYNLSERFNRNVISEENYNKKQEAQMSSLNKKVRRMDEESHNWEIHKALDVIKDAGLHKQNFSFYKMGGVT